MGDKRMKEKIALLEEIMEVDEGTLQADTELAVLNEWDSFTKLCVLAELKKRKDITINPKELETCKTVSDVLKYL